MLKTLRTFSILAALALPCATATAYEVSPMIYDMAPTGQGATSVIRVHNTNAQPITIEIQAERRMFNDKGEESRAPADADFVLFPPQAIVQPGATQAVRIQYVGATTLDTSSTYTITVKQVPVKLPNDGKSGVQFVFNFSTVANIVPPGTKAQVDVVSIAPTGKTLTLTLKNNGNKYANLALSHVDLAGGTFKSTIKDDVWRKALGTSWILPGNTRIIEIPKPAGAPATLTAKFTLVEATQ
jgi:fimbrial chaperone protein